MSTSVFGILLPAFAECLVLVGIHSYLGLHVIQRKVIFVDLAFAQIAAVGTLVAFLFGIPPHTPGSFVFALALTAIGAAIFSLCRFRRSRIPQEAIIGLVYAIAAAVAILLIDRAPHGAEHLKEIMTGSILWVKWSSILTAAGVYSVVGLFHFAFRRRFLLISRDSDAAWESGLNVRLWDFLFYLSFGLVITLSVDVAGVLIVFVFLVAPAILAILVSDRLRTQLVIGWVTGVVVTTAGLALAYVEDLSTGPAVIACYGATLLLVAVGIYVRRAARPLAAVGRVVGVGLAFGAAIGLLWVGGTLLGRTYRTATAPPPAASPAEQARARVADPADTCDAVLAVLRVGGDGSVEAAIDFLRTEPPPFFRDQVLDELTAALGSDPGFRRDEPMDSPANEEAARRALR